MERNREWLMISVLVANYLHDARILDCSDPAQKLGPLGIDTIVDGDIPVRIELQKDWSGPAWIRWHLWPDEPGRRTWGTMSVCRLSVAKAILEVGTYDRSRQRSSRFAKIPHPVGKWGISSAGCKQYGVKTTY